MKFQNLIDFEQAQNWRLQLIISGIAIFAAGLILPVIILFIVQFTGYSEVLEEFTKAAVILFLILKLPDLKWQLLGAIGFGFLFGLSENFLYLGQIFTFGDWSVFEIRFLLPLPMHIATVLILLFSALAGKKYIVLGLIATIFLHLYFNSVIANY